MTKFKSFLVYFILNSTVFGIIMYLSNELGFDKKSLFQVLFFGVFMGLFQTFIFKKKTVDKQ
jgi:hypothetical protein